MKIPSNWNSVFSNIFYDKEISVLIRSDQYDSEGGLVSVATVPSSSFFGNVRFKNLEADQENLGLRYNIDIVITAPLDTSIELNNILEYRNIKYLITDLMPFDSHLMVVCRRWKSE